MKKNGLRTHAILLSAVILFGIFIPFIIMPIRGYADYWDEQGNPAVFDDFNDSSVNATQWVVNYGGGGSGYVSEYNGYLKINLNSGSGKLQTFRIINPVNLTDINIQVDKMILSVGNNEYADIFIGNVGVWEFNVYVMRFSPIGGGQIEIWRDIDGVENIFRIVTGRPNFSQYRIGIHPNASDGNAYYISFYENNEILASQNCEWFIDTLDEGYGYIGFSNEGIGNAVTSTIAYDNFYTWYGAYSQYDIYTIRYAPQNIQYTNSMFPQTYLNESQTDLILTYPNWQNISFHISLKDGFELHSYSINSTPNIVDLTGEAVFIIPDIEENMNITLTILLMSGYRVMDLNILGLGISTSPEEGIYAYPLNTLVNLTANLFLLTPPTDYADFEEWEIIFQSGTFTSANLQTSFYLSSNATVNAKGSLPNLPNRFFYRGAEINTDTPPAPYYMATNQTDILINMLRANMNYTYAINYIDLRIGWTMVNGLPQLYFHPRFYSNGTIITPWDDRQVTPTLQQADYLIHSAKKYGYKIYVSANPEWNMPNAIVENWDNLTQVRNFLIAYRINVVIPLASWCQLHGVDDFSIALEMGESSNTADNDNYFIYTHCNDIWTETIRQVRIVFKGRVTQQLNTGYRAEDFAVVKRASYLTNLDYLVLDNFFILQTNSTIYSANTVSRAYYNSYGGANMFAIYQDLYQYFNKLLVINQAYANAYNMMSAPYQETYTFRHDKSQLNAWLGTIRAYRGQQWIGGIDFERYNENYWSRNYSDYTIGRYGEELYYTSAWSLVNSTQQAIRDELLTLMPYSNAPVPMTTVINVQDIQYIGTNIFMLSYAPFDNRYYLFDKKIYTFTLTCLFANSTPIDNMNLTLLLNSQALFGIRNSTLANGQYVFTLNLTGTKAYYYSDVPTDSPPSVRNIVTNITRNINTNLVFRIYNYGSLITYNTLTFPFKWATYTPSNIPIGIPTVTGIFQFVFGQLLGFCLMVFVPTVITTGIIKASKLFFIILIAYATLSNYMGTLSDQFFFIIIFISLIMTFIVARMRVVYK